MKEIPMIYPGLKKDYEGKLTERKLALVEWNEFIGRKMRKSGNRREEPHKRARKNYITF